MPATAASMRMPSRGALRCNWISRSCTLAWAGRPPALVHAHPALALPRHRLQFHPRHASPPPLPVLDLQVEGTHDPLEARIVLHGWFTQPAPFFAGAVCRMAAAASRPGGLPAYLPACLPRCLPASQPGHTFLEPVPLYAPTLTTPPGCQAR